MNINIHISRRNCNYSHKRANRNHNTNGKQVMVILASLSFYEINMTKEHQIEE